MCQRGLGVTARSIPLCYTCVSHFLSHSHSLWIAKQWLQAPVFLRWIYIYGWNTPLFQGIFSSGIHMTILVMAYSVCVLSLLWSWRTNAPTLTRSLSWRLHSRIAHNFHHYNKHMKWLIKWSQRQVFHFFFSLYFCFISFLFFPNSAKTLPRFCLPLLSKHCNALIRDKWLHLIHNWFFCLPSTNESNKEALLMHKSDHTLSTWGDISI